MRTRGFGEARTRAEVYFEHAAADEAAGRYPSPVATVDKPLVLKVTVGVYFRRILLIQQFKKGGHYMSRKLEKGQAGFTIVELLIVIVVIGILAALVITTFTGIQQKARNTERTTDVKAMHGQVEAYYAQKGYYPSLTDINGSAWRTTNMKGLDQEALKDPKGAGYTLATAPSATSYSYAVANSAGTSCEADDTTCTTYTLTATLEGGGTFAKSNLN